MTIWEKFGTSGRGTGVDSIVGVVVGASFETITGGYVGRGSGVTGDSEGVDAVKVGWHAEASKETRMIIHKRRLIKFISISFYTDYKSKIQVY
jgi:hypothetical protein